MSPTNENTGLRMLAGAWSGVEIIAASKWGPGGEAHASCVYRLALDGKALLHDYQAERDGKPWLSAHAVFVFDAQNGEDSLFWFDSLGFVPAQAAAGTHDGDTFEFVRVSPRGRTRHSYRCIDADHYSMALHSSFDDGASWVTVMEGLYTRIV